VSPFDPVAKALQYEASAKGGALLIMGAYGHWRWREWVFGGVTQEVLRDTNRAGPHGPLAPSQYAIEKACAESDGDRGKRIATHGALDFIERRGSHGLHILHLMAAKSLDVFGEAFEIDAQCGQVVSDPCPVLLGPTPGCHFVIIGAISSSLSVK